MDTNIRWPSQELNILSGKGKDTEEKHTAAKHWMSIYWHGWIFQECLPSVPPLLKVNFVHMPETLKRVFVTIV